MNTAVIILLLAGAILIILSFVWLLGIYELLPLLEDKYKKKIGILVKIQHIFMAMFVFGYTRTAFEISHGHSEHKEIAIGLIFFFGGLYVLNSTYLKMILVKATASVIRGLIPICAKCKKIRSGEDSESHEAKWQAIEIYLGGTKGLKFSHGLCPDCIKEFEAEL